MTLSLLESGRQASAEVVDLDLYESSPDCIKILRPDGTIKTLNAGGQIALELDHRGQLDGLNWPSLWPGSEQSRVARAVAEAREGKRSQFLAFCPTLKNTPRWWDVVVTPMAGASPAVAGLLVVSRDVTELVRAKDELARVNVQKDSFLAILSHELRNPLSALAMAGKVIAASHGDAVQLGKMSALIARQVAHMERLTEDLLDVSRITRGRVNLQLEELDLHGIVHDVGEQLAPMLSAKGQALHKPASGLPVLVTGDRVRLVQVLGNLVANASRYSPAGASIAVAVMADAQHGSLCVSDEGKGIAHDVMPTLFDLFSQGQAGIDGKGSGIGVGLGIVKGLVELHGGSVRVASLGVGQGSRFTVALPLAAAACQACPA